MKRTLLVAALALCMLSARSYAEEDGGRNDSSSQEDTSESSSNQDDAVGSTPDTDRTPEPDSDDSESDDSGSNGIRLPAATGGPRG